MGRNRYPYRRRHICYCKSPERKTDSCAVGLAWHGRQSSACTSGYLEVRVAGFCASFCRWRQGRAENRIGRGTRLWLGPIFDPRLLPDHHNSAPKGPGRDTWSQLRRFNLFFGRKLHFDHNLIFTCTTYSPSRSRSRRRRCEAWREFQPFSVSTADIFAW